MAPRTTNPPRWLTEVGAGLLLLWLLPQLAPTLDGEPRGAFTTATTWALSMALLSWMQIRMGRRLLEGVRSRPPGSTWKRMLRDDTGSASVSFVLALPVFLIVFAVVIQLALICNAALVVNYASFTAARSAIVSLPAGDRKAPRQSAALALSGISPAGRGTGSSISEGRYMYRTLRRSGVRVVPSFPRRYSYAMAACSTRPSGRLSQMSGAKDVTVKVRYQFQLTVPGAATVLRPSRTRVAGVSGRFWPIPASCELRASPGRSNPGGAVGTITGFLF